MFEQRKCQHEEHVLKRGAMQQLGMQHSQQGQLEYNWGRYCCPLFLFTAATSLPRDTPTLLQALPLLQPPPKNTPTRLPPPQETPAQTNLGSLHVGCHSACECLACRPPQCVTSCHSSEAVTLG